MNVNYAAVILDEISLEGLDGITLESLWVRLRARLECEVPARMRERFWHIIIRLQDVELYVLPEPRTTIQPAERQKGIFEHTSYMDHPTEDIYPYTPVFKVPGSCQHFRKRRLVSAEARRASHQEACDKWGNSLVVVASLESRWKAISVGQPLNIATVMTPTLYCMLERLGRSRYNGESSVGKNSLLSLGEDSKGIFYLRTKLVNLGFATKSTIISSVEQKNTRKWVLMHLARFQRNVQSTSDSTYIYSTMRRAILASPRRICDFLVIKRQLAERLAEQLTHKALKKILISPIFKDNFKKTQGVPYRTLYPDAPEHKWKLKTGLERSLTTIELAKEEPDDDVDEDIKDTWEESGACPVGEPLLWSVFGAVHAAGETGLSLKQASRQLGLDFLSVRMALRYLTKFGIIVLTMEDNYRQRISMYISAEYAKESAKSFQEEERKISHHIREIMEDEHTDQAKPNADMIKDSILTTPETLKFKKKYGQLSKLAKTRKSLTPRKQIVCLRQLKRITAALEIVQKHKVILTPTNYLKYIMEYEKERGIQQGNIDRRSLARITTKLERAGQLVIHRVKTNANLSPHVFFCLPHITQDHPMLQAMLRVQPTFPAPQPGQPQHRCPNRTAITREHGYLPKFVRISALHEFMFYLIYCHRNEVCEKETDNVKKTIVQRGLEVYGDVKAYAGAPEKFKFVPPLPSYGNRGPGWALAIDLIDNLPLTLFLNIVNISYRVPGLMDYRRHPVLCNILMRNLPEDMQRCLMLKKKYIYSTLEQVEKLCMLGLAKFGEQLCKVKDKVFIYLNRFTTITDTTSSEPGYCKVEDKEYPKESLEFKSMGDVSWYWEKIRDISCSTRLGERVIGEEIEFINSESKLVSYLKHHQPEEAELLDDGSVPGDGLGAAGFDSVLFTHIPRSWKNAVPISEYKTNRTLMIKPDKNNYKRKKRLLPRELTEVNDRKGDEKVTNQGKGRKRKVVKRILKPRQNKNPKVTELDELDLKALLNLSKQRVSWTPKQDLIIYAAKIAYSIMMPGKTFIPVKFVRDLFHQLMDNPDKTTKACHRRLRYFIKHSKSKYLLQTYISEARNCPQLMRRYSELYDKMKIKKDTPDYAKLMNVFKIHFVECVMDVQRRIIQKDVTNKVPFVIPDSIEEFNIKFMSGKEQLQPKREATIQDVQEGIISVVIHSSLSYPVDKQPSGFAKFQIFSNFSESALRNTITKLKSSMMIASKYSTRRAKKFLGNSTPMISNSFYLSQSYRHTLITNVPFRVFSEAVKYIDNLKGRNDKQSTDSLDSGAIVILTEKNTSGLIDLKLHLPDDLFTVDTSEAKKLGAWEAGGMEQAPSRSTMSSFLVGEDVEKQHLHDSIKLIACQLEPVLKCDPGDLIKVSPERIKELIDYLIRDAVFPNKDSYDLTDDVLSLLIQDHYDVELVHQLIDFIDLKGNMGASAVDIKEHFVTKGQYSKLSVHRHLTFLNSHCIIRRVGIDCSHFILPKHNNWWFIPLTTIVKREDDQALRRPGKRVRSESTDDAMNKRIKIDDGNDDVGRRIEIDGSGDHVERCDQGEETSGADIDDASNDDKELMMDENDEEDDSKVNKWLLNPRPWIGVYGELCSKVLWRWAGSLVLHMHHYPVLSLASLETRFRYLQPHIIRLLTEFLTSIGCCKMFTTETHKCSIWDDDNVPFEPTTSDTTMLDDSTDVYVHLEFDALSTVAAYRYAFKEHQHE